MSLGDPALHGTSWRRFAGRPELRRPCPRCGAIVGEPCRLTVADGAQHRPRMCKAVIHAERCGSAPEPR